MADREISIFLKWRELCELLKKDGAKEARREEDRGIIAAILAFLGSTSDIPSWGTMCKILREERVKEASQEGTRGIIAAILLLVAKEQQ